MINMLLSGALGYMSKVIYNTTLNEDDMRVVEGVDIAEATTPFPVYDSYDKVKVKPDVAVDFSHPKALDAFLAYCLQNNVPAVVCTTGHSEAQKQQIHNAASSIPVFYTFNTSLGIALMCSLVRQAALVLGEGYDIEIIEKHHRRKVDAPSGTAIMLYDSINEACEGTKQAVYNRNNRHEPRSANEIGMLSVRGGTMTGEHSVLFCGEDEILEINHITHSRNVFAAGTVRAARFLSGQKPGLYDMDDVVAWLNE